MAAAAPKKKLHRIGLFGPGVFLILLALGWSGYWYFTASYVNKALHAQQDGLIKQGYQVSVDPYRITGWPYRIHILLKNLTIVAPSGRGFKVPELDVNADAYDLDKWVMDAPNGLILYRGRPGGIDYGKLTVTAASIRASVSGLRKPVQDARFQATKVVVTPSDPSHPYIFDTTDLFEAYLRPHMTASGGASASAGIDPESADWLIRLNGAHGQTRGFVGNLSPDKPLTISTEGTLNHISAFRGKDFASGVTAWKAAGGTATYFKSMLSAGDLAVTASSTGLGLDADSRLTGHMDIEISDGAKPLDVLASAGLISRDHMTLAKPLLDMTFSALGPHKFGIDFKQGGSYIGPLKVSDAPVLP
jgi:hypothetical protein